ncbi:uncharacterized protein LOC110056706 [Orbicella faveolata]|uniref:uncharacterized protein LOC110056706 n=1 Tax=Orbicella faveolata TaxID=48498 RepID=UPI0009E5DDA0|nr:uncharacterized protein LOC110056706 [Orbicella faveolata]
MGCSAGKHMTTSPEVSSSSHSAKENGCTVHTPDVPRHSLESSALNTKRKDSSNSISSVKEPDIPEPKNDINKDKNEDRILSKKTVPIRPNDNFCTTPKPVPVNQIRVQMTKSQLEFFRMLDQKIDAGPDYISETES